MKIALELAIAVAVVAFVWCIVKEWRRQERALEESREEQERKRARERIKRRVELIDELVRRAECFWSCNDVEAAASLGTGEMNLILAYVFCHEALELHCKKVAELVGLEADWADKAGRLAAGGGRSAQGVDGHCADGNTAKFIAEGKALLRRHDALTLASVFRLEFAGLAHELFNTTVRGGKIFFERGDLAAAKERAASLRQLAEFLDKFDETGDCGDFHGDILP